MASMKHTVNNTSDCQPYSPHQGQLEALERDVQTDVECEFLVTQASAIEKRQVALSCID